MNDILAFSGCIQISNEVSLRIGVPVWQVAGRELAAANIMRYYEKSFFLVHKESI